MVADAPTTLDYTPCQDLPGWADVVRARQRLEFECLGHLELYDEAATTAEMGERIDRLRARLRTLDEPRWVQVGTLNGWPVREVR